MEAYVVKNNIAELGFEGATNQREVHEHSSLIDSLRCILRQLARVISLFINQL